MFLVFLNPWVYCFLASSSLFDVENLNMCVQQQGGGSRGSLVQMTRAPMKWRLLWLSTVYHMLSVCKFLRQKL